MRLEQKRAQARYLFHSFILLVFLLLLLFLLPLGVTKVYRLSLFLSFLS